MREAVERSTIYGPAGASGFFIPGLTDVASIAQICREVQLPVNVEISDGMPSIARLIKAGVGRISHGLVPYIRAMAALETDAAKLLSSERSLRFRALPAVRNPSEKLRVCAAGACKDPRFGVGKRLALAPDAATAITGHLEVIGTNGNQCFAALRSAE